MGRLLSKGKKPSVKVSQRYLYIAEHQFLLVRYEVTIYQSKILSLSKPNFSTEFQQNARGVNESQMPFV